MHVYDEMSMDDGLAFRLPERPAKMLRPGDLPNRMLAHLDRVWSQRKAFNAEAMLSAELVRDEDAKKHVRAVLAERVAELLDSENRGVIATTGPTWWIRSFGGEREDIEVTEDLLREHAAPGVLVVVKVTGLSVPAYTGEVR